MCGASLWWTLSPGNGRVGWEAWRAAQDLAGWLCSRRGLGLVWIGCGFSPGDEQSRSAGNGYDRSTRYQQHRFAPDEGGRLRLCPSSSDRVLCNLSRRGTGKTGRQQFSRRIAERPGRRARWRLAPAGEQGDVCHPCRHRRFRACPAGAGGTPGGRAGRLGRHPGSGGAATLSGCVRSPDAPCSRCCKGVNYSYDHGWCSEATRLPPFEAPTPRAWKAPAAFWSTACSD
ncbi:hypothetical protein OF001_U310015 [Pseudomonas sp. OF001]|nr:hypothetical protein OF001_U310015 [Pseudomonas sp. OF001]